MSELMTIKKHLDDATTAESVFGYVKTNTIEDNKAMVKKVYTSIAKSIHPDHNGNSKESQDAFSTLNDIRSHADSLISLGDYGKNKFLPGRAPVTIMGKYTIKTGLVAGPIADIHIASTPSIGHVIVKAVRDYNNNDLLVAEVRNLTGLRKKLQGPWLDTIPEIIESIMLDEGAVQKKINVMNYFWGFLTLEEVTQRLATAHKELDGRIVAWMWKRLLLMSDWIYKSGYIHGAILPNHVMVFPDNLSKEPRDKRKHSIRLVGWANSIEIKSKTRLAIIEPKWKHLYAPEILSKSKLGPSTDMYMAATTLSHVLTGSSSTIPPFLRKSLEQCMVNDPVKRPKDAKLHFEKFVKTLLTEYGPPKWHDFILP